MSRGLGSGKSEGRAGKAVKMGIIAVHSSVEGRKKSPHNGCQYRDLQNGMSQNPIPRPDASNAMSTDRLARNPANSRSAAEPSSSVSQLAKALEAHGGGAVSFDVAFDLVLNEIVEQARNACGATGSAIALARGGEMICRATSGANAPDLGVRVDTSSGLVAECLNTAQVQHCADTEMDPRVNAAACRWLGVRSMLMAPVVEEGTALGILEVFSDRPNAFAVGDLATLLALAQRIVQHKKEVENGRTAMNQGENAPVERDGQTPLQGEEEAIFSAEQENSSTSGRWTVLLGLLVIAAAIALGGVLGWRGATRGLKSVPATPAKEASVRANPAAQREEPGQNTSSVAEPSTPSSAKTSSFSNSQAATGGLVVTQDGKVIYRMEPAPRPATKPAPASSTAPPSLSLSRLIHRVDPQYPEEARTKHIQGSVVLDVQVQGEGIVGNIDVVQGDPLLTEAAVQAVKQWRYQPYFVNGRPVESQTRITIKFTLPAD